MDTEVVTYWVEGGSDEGPADLVWSMAAPPSESALGARSPLAPLAPLAVDAHVVVNVAQLCSVTPTEAIKALQVHGDRWLPVGRFPVGCVTGVILN